MARPEVVERFPWLATGAGAALVVIGIFSLLRFPAPPQPNLAQGRSPLQLTEFGLDTDDVSFQEELMLQDPIPLFLPTPWNSGQADLRAGLRPLATVRFSSFAPLLAFEGGPAVPLFDPPPAPQNALEASLIQPKPVAPGLSQRDVEVESLAPRLLHFEVRRVSDGHLVTEVAARLNEAAQPEAAGPLRQEFWAPLEMLAGVDTSGLVGQPALVVSSGSERVDQWVLDFLVRQAHLGGRLPPGFYRVVVGP